MPIGHIFFDPVFVMHDHLQDSPGIWSATRKASDIDDVPDHVTMEYVTQALTDLNWTDCTSRNNVKPEGQDSIKTKFSVGESCLKLSVLKTEVGILQQVTSNLTKLYSIVLQPKTIPKPLRFQCV